MLLKWLKLSHSVTALLWQSVGEMNEKTLSIFVINGRKTGPALRRSRYSHDSYANKITPTLANCQMEKLTRWPSSLLPSFKSHNCPWSFYSPLSQAVASMSEGAHKFKGNNIAKKRIWEITILVTDKIINIKSSNYRENILNIHGHCYCYFNILIYIFKSPRTQQQVLQTVQIQWTFAKLMSK